MSLSKRNSNELRERIVNLDFLRGFFIILALNQHFAYYLNMWYVEYFRDSLALSSTYAVHFSMIGKNLAVDKVSYWLAIIFTPWVSQVYLTMAAFNLGKYSQDDLKNDNNKKFKIYLLILLFFIGENLIVAPNLGQGLSFYPIMLWMLVLSILNLVYRYLGITGILILATFSLLRFMIPIELISDFFEELVQAKVHPGFEYDAKIEYFILSGCLGFLIGHIYYFKYKYLRFNYKMFIPVGVALSLPHLLWGIPFQVNPSDVFASEHDLSRTFLGTLFILGVQAIVIPLFLWLEENQIKINIRLVNWIGINSILIFAFHRIIFVKVIAPISTLVHAMMNEVLSASTAVIYLYIAITILICYVLQKSPLLNVIVKK